MLDTNDIAQLRGMFGELLVENNRTLKREIRDETHSIVSAAVFASEQRLIQRIDDVEKNLRQEIHDVKDAVIDIIDESVLPQIEEHRVDILRVKKHLQLA